jgi:polyphenol oxidase
MKITHNQNECQSPKVWQGNFGCSDIIAQFGDKRTDKTKLIRLLGNCLLFEVEQTHSDEVIIAGRENENKIFPRADALVTREDKIALVIRTADCFPILFYDPVAKIIGAAHSGREGTRKNIAQAVIKALIDLGAKSENIMAAIGPGISTRAYEVDRVTWQNFCQSTDTEHEYPFLDVRQTIVTQLNRSKIHDENICHQKICTYSDRDFHSWRRDNTMQRQYNWIVINPGC